MSYRLSDIKHETHDFWVLQAPKGFEVYRKGITHSTRVASIGLGLERVIAECNKRQKELEQS